MGGGLIELLQAVFDAAEKVVGFGVAGVGFQGVVEQRDGFVGFASLQIGIGGGQA